MLTKKRIRPRCIALLAVLLAALFISLPCALAQQTAFHEDYAAIDRAAQSVVLLEVYDQTEKLVATGSGFVAFDNQTVVTNYHVIEGAYLIKAYGDAGFFYRINDVIAADESKDIAILSFESPSIIQPLELAHDAKLMRGEPVVAIGSPVGIKNTVSMGNISTLLEDDVGTVIQFTAPISHGSSGGALFNARGQVIGVTFATLEAGQNLNYAVDIDDVIALYANRIGDKKSFVDYFASLMPAPTATPASSGKRQAILSNLTAKQIGPNSVELKWQDDGNSVAIYHVNVYISQPGKWDEQFVADIAKQTSYVVKDLVPGFEYTFYVSATNSRKLSTTLIVQEADQFTSRNFNAQSFGLYYHNTGEYIWDAKRTKVEALKLDDLKKVGVARDYAFILEMTVSNSNAVSNWDVLFAVIMPDGSIEHYTTTMSVEKESEYGWSYAWYMHDLMADYARSKPKGTHTVKLYINGQYATQTSFKVK